MQGGEEESFKRKKRKERRQEATRLKMGIGIDRRQQAKQGLLYIVCGIINHWCNFCTEQDSKKMGAPGARTS